MPKEESVQSLEDEIHALEEKLLVRKTEEAEMKSVEKPREEKEIFRDVLKEHVEHAKELPVVSPGSIPQTSPHDYTLQVKGKADDIREKEHHEQVTALVEIALTKGILDAVQVARHLNSPHLLDDFHDMLVDEYYEKLLQSRVISP